MKAAKSLISKCKLDCTDAYQAILEVRNAPPQGMGSSPVQCLMNRSTRSLLPTRNDNLITRRTTIHYDRQQMRKYILKIKLIVMISMIGIHLN